MGKLEQAKKNNNENLIDINDLSLTLGFWKNFAESVWEKDTFVKTKDFLAPPISAEELFKCVVEMSIQHCLTRDAGGDQNDIRIYLESVEARKDYDHLLPKLSDSDFDGYSHRIRQDLHGRTFVFVIDQITMPKSLKIWTNNFLKGMYRPLGAISHANYWSISFGDYSTSPDGVCNHSNALFSEGAFCFPIIGEKNVTVWDPAYVRDNPEVKGSRHYIKHIQEATHLSAGPGGMMYWPSDRWHTESSEGGDISMVLSVRGFSDVYLEFLGSITDLPMLFSYKPSGLRKWVCHFIEAFLLVAHVLLIKFSERARQNQIRSLPCDVDDLQASAQEIPEGLRKIGSRLNVRFYFGKNIEKALSAFWLFHLTNLGAESQNDPFPPIKLMPKLRIRRSAEIVLLWRQVDNKTLLLVADRYVHEIPSQFLPLIKYIAGIEVEQEIVYDNLVDLSSGIDCSPQESEDELSLLLKFLGESGTFYTT
ncbi:MAG: hypothetical protein ACI9WC_000125 [Arenicella sp.]|jgi:hypothetical protein